jgi:hypothetical protein
MNVVRYTQAELMERNLLLVWNQRDPLLRKAAMESIYAIDSTYFDEAEKVSGYEAINTQIGKILMGMPSDFVFHMNSTVRINHNIGRLTWSVGTVDGPTAASGMDIAFFKDGRIQALYVFLDK